MAETTDDLSTPLGQKAARKPRFRLPFSGTQAIAAVLGLILAGFAGFALFTDNPLGGEPVAACRDHARREPGEAEKSAEGHGERRGQMAKRSPPKPNLPNPSPPGANRPPDHHHDRRIDHSARHDVVVAGERRRESREDRTPGRTAPAMVGGINTQLLEKSRYGMIPIAADRMRPVTAYAGSGDTDRAAKVAKTPSHLRHRRRRPRRR